MINEISDVVDEKPTFGERVHEFWMEPKKVDPEYADRITSGPAVVIGIGTCFLLMAVVSMFMG